jgi:hypothetical protein
MKKTPITKVERLKRRKMQDLRLRLERGVDPSLSDSTRSDLAAAIAREEGRRLMGLPRRKRIKALRRLRRRSLG